MSQFDVYKNPNPKTNINTPYLLDIQHDILKYTTTRVVIPLVIDAKQLDNLNPQVTIKNKSMILSTSELATVGLCELGEKVCSLENKRSEIISAIDFLVTGY